MSSLAKRTPGISSPLIWGALAFGVVSMSLSAIFIRLAESPAMTIATNRMLASVLLLAPFALLYARRDLGRVTRRDLLALAISGTCLAAHFGTWTASLAYTSVASSVLFVSLHPVVVVLVEWLALLLWTMATGEDVWSFPPRDLLWFILLALFATVGGHTIFNWSLRYLSASTVAVTFVGEAVALLVALGSAIVLGGIYVTARADRV
ncbi:MAG: EamA family transporter [Chloroflexota bacterium]|nr:EamA family transporter [Chloroflexota bacterium]